MHLPLKATLLCLTLLAGAHHAMAADDAPATTRTMGFGLAAMPEYAGASKERVLPLLYVDYQNANGFFASSFRGIGYGTKVDGVGLSAALAYDPGRADKKESWFVGSDALKGMGKIKGAALAKLGASFELGGITLSAGANLALSNRERGNSYQLGVSMPLMNTASDQLSVAGTAKYGDRKYMQTYFGVTAAQSAASSYKAFNAKSGMDEIAAGLTWNHVIDKAWSVRTVAGVTRQMGDAADSPLTRKKTAPALISTVNYSF